MNLADRLYHPLTLRGLEIPNRLWLSPMCQYSAVDGLVQPWHLRHYAERAVGGAGLIIVEATAVQPRGRISAGDLGLWNDDQKEAFRPLVTSVHEHGAKIAVQLAHAGRKASSRRPWEGSGAVPVSEGGWPVVSVGTEPVDAPYAIPEALDEAGIRGVISDFASAAHRAVQAGFDAVELHAAHGYLIHQFLSPLTNRRTDRWGGTPENRARLALEITRAVRAALPDSMPLLIRVSATDWVEGGWDVAATISLLRELKKEGVDFVDVSSGGLLHGVKIPVGPGYQVPFAAEIKAATGLATGTVGLLSEVGQIYDVLEGGRADVVLLGRLLLRDPYFPARMAPPERRRVPVQYQRGF